MVQKRRSDHQDIALYHPPEEKHSNRFDGGATILMLQLEEAARATGVQERLLPGRLELKETQRLGLQICREFTEPCPTSDLIIECLALEVLDNCLARKQRGQRRTPAWLATVIEIANDRYAERLTLADVAGTVGVHPVHLARHFRSRLGCTFGEFLRQIRLSRAQEQLRQTRKGLAEISIGCGFADQSHFARLFTTAFGTPPGKYRANVSWRRSRRYKCAKLNRTRGQRMRRGGLLRVVKTIAVLCVSFLVALPLWNLAATTWNHAYTPVQGSMHLVNGHQMHIYCSGSGSPTIVFESAATATWLAWRRVQPQLSQVTRVCTYDRAGHGWSEPRPGMRDAEAVVRELHALLNLAEVKRPLVLAGHSAGGLYVREYARQFPAEVVGIVLIDSSSPEQLDEIPGWRASYERARRDLPNQRRWETLSTWSGWDRLMGRCRVDASGESAYFVEQYEAMLCRPGYVGGEDSEYMDFEQTCNEAARLRSFGNIPLLVISRDTDLPSERKSPIDAAREDAWARSQEHLQSLSPLSWRVIARGAGHSVQHDRLDLVVDQVSILIRYLRGGAPPPFAQTLVGHWKHRVLEALGPLGPP